MKLTKPLLVLLVLLSAEIMQNIAYARPSAEIERDLAEASETAVATYNEVGMSGLMIITQECYEKKTKSPFYCIYLDLASRHIDQIFIKAMHFPPNEFFSDDQFGPRIWSVLANANMDANTANQYLASVTPLISFLVDKEILDKK